MSQSDTPNVQVLSTEVSQLRQELQLRDSLVQQLSQELFRLVKGNTSFMPQQQPDLERDLTQLQALQEQLQAVEQQVAFYQEQIATRDSEIYQLRQSVQELTDRTRMLEQVVQELPQIYRRKFEERMTPVREKVAMLQRENRQLQAELQSVSYRLALKTRNASHSGIDLPNFPRPASEETNISTPQNA
ncbi:Npun_F5560 family protein [Nostoc sp.]|uniref:Npun_F5560 family protein n=1 Tax=Nostoc sp. TaxID=1180 RepID=UPI002FF9E2C9